MCSVPDYPHEGSSVVVTRADRIEPDAIPFRPSSAAVEPYVDSVGVVFTHSGTAFRCWRGFYCVPYSNPYVEEVMIQS